MDYEACNIPVKMLKPSQADLDLEKVFRALDGDASTYMISPIQLGDPLVTFNGEQIIDGHHRWATIFMMNPAAEVACLDFQSNESLDEFLDRFDGARASKEKIKKPLQRWIKKDKKAQRKEIGELLDRGTVDQLIEYGKVDDSGDFGSMDVGKMRAITYIVDNLKELAKHKAPKSAAKRKDMPQLTAKEAYLDENEEFWDYKTGTITGKNLFDTHKTGTGLDSYISDPENYKRKYGAEMSIVQMTPEEYFEACAEGFGSSVGNQKRQIEADKSVLQHLNRVIDEYGRQFPIAYLNYAGEGGSFGQEGRHRMYVAGERFGWDTKFPVLVFRRTEDALFVRPGRSTDKYKWYVGMGNRTWFGGNNLQELRDTLWSLEGAVKYSLLEEMATLIRRTVKR